MRILSVFALALLSIAFTSPIVLASAITIVGNPSDGEVEEPGDVNFGGEQGRVGRGGNSGSERNHSVVYLFELPALLPTEFISSAVFEFSLTELTNPPITFSADLYGLGWVSSSSSIQASWFWGQSTDDNRTGNDLGTGIGSNQIRKLQNDIASSIAAGASMDTPVGRVETDTQGSASLLSYLELLYETGATAGDLAVLRLSADASIGGGPRVGYRVSFADDGAGNSPTLSLDIQSISIPEPSSSFLMAGGLILGVSRRSRHRQSVPA